MYYPFMVSKIVPEERKCLVCSSIFLVGGTGNGRREQVYCSWPCRSSAKVNSNGQPPNVLTATQAAYLAGIIDADGHIGIYGHTSKPGATSYYRPHLDVSNTDLNLLEWIKEVVGRGSIHKQRDATATSKTTYYWHCSVGAIAPLLEQLIEFMIVKRARAELVVDFRKRLQDPVLKADKTWQLEYREMMLSFNKRGPRGADH
jgi:hypothetical protein